MSVPGSPLRNLSVVDVLVAVKVSLHDCHICVVVAAVVLFVHAVSDVPSSDTSTVLVVPNMPPGL